MQIPTLYRGPLVFESNAFKRARFPGGYVEGGKAHFYVCDLQGSVRQVLDGSTGAVEQETHYYPYGTPFGESTAERLSSANGASVQPYLYGGKERLALEGFNAYDYGDRMQFSDLGIFGSPDPLADNFHPFSQYLYCAGDPINRIDPSGLSWKATINEISGHVTGYQWVPEDESYDENGNLLPGLHRQAKFFSEGGSKGKYDPRSNKNIGTSTATVYLADGSTISFDACTYPDTNDYSYLPDGIYEAKFGLHRNYIALNVASIGTTYLTNRQIEIPGFVNKKTHEEGFYFLDIHKAGIANTTRASNPNKPISEACLLIDVNKWDEFISLFNNPNQRNNIVSISVSRYLSEPLNFTIPKISIQKLAIGMLSFFMLP